MIIPSKYCLVTVFTYITLSSTPLTVFMSSWAMYYSVNICRAAVNKAGSQMTQNCP